MRNLAVVVILVLSVMTSVSRASIENVTAADDGDGVLTCTTGYETGVLTIDGVHNIFDAGHVLGTITTDTAEDPMLIMSNSMDNDTGLAWIAYHVNVSMDSPFTISNDNVTLPADWSSTITSQPVLVGSSYVGQIDYTAGTPVANGDTLNFGYTIEFSGATMYSFCQELIPVSVPEPTTLALATCGLLGLFALRRRSA